MPAKINKIAIFDGQPTEGARLFEVRVAEPTTRRGEYDGVIELIVTNPQGYVPREELRATARRELRRTGQRNAQVRRIQRIAA
jgi:hypothetical protein